MNKTSDILVLPMMFLFLFGHSQTTTTEDNHSILDVAISIQVYSAGYIPTLNLEHYLDKQTSVVYRLGVNIVDRQDFSDENNQETGAGFGGSLGYRKHFPLKKGKVIVGLNVDVWNLWIDWENNVNGLNRTHGTTFTLVAQPWLEGGYFLNIHNSASQLGATLGFGREINAITNGRDVEQGWIASITIQYQFSRKK